MNRIPIFAISVLLVTALSLRAQVTEPKTGKTFAATIAMPHFDDVKLHCAGAGIRTKFGFQVYAGGLYLDEATAPSALAAFKGQNATSLQENEKFFGALIKAACAKAVVMKFVRTVGSAKIREIYEEGLEKSLGEIGKSPVKADAEKFLALFNDEIADGEELAIYIHNGSTVNVFAKGKEKGSVENAKIAEAVFAIWFGADPVSGDLKKGLVSQVAWAVK